jgi:hypothetical protein
VRVNPVAGFLAVTVAPGTTAPFGSVTVPVKSAALDWAQKSQTRRKTSPLPHAKNFPAMAEILKILLSLIFLLKLANFL